MKHTTKYNVLQAILTTLIFGCALAYGVKTGSAVAPIIALVLIFLLPNAIQGFFWHEFFLGRALIRKGQWKESAFHLEKFLGQLKRRPWLKCLIALRWASYTRKIEAMALSNLGVALINQGEIEKAEKILIEANEIDPRYAIPYFNLALVALVNGDEKRGRDLLEKSREFGYQNVEYQQVVNLSKSIKERPGKRKG